MKPSKNRRFSFVPNYRRMQEVIADSDLATLGDAYTNLIYSLYLSTRTGRPTGAKASSRILSSAVKEAGLRELMPSRLDRHKLADAAEALLVYSWLDGSTTITESLETLVKYGDDTEAFSQLLKEAKKKLDL